MGPLTPWLNRDDPSYDPNRIGAISQAKVMTALVEAGKIVLTPYVNVCQYDLVIEEGGRFFRVQVKTGRIFREAICFRPHRLRAAKSETGWVRKMTTYQGAIDYFGVYCPEIDRCYLVPIADVTSYGTCSLRLSPAKNNQSKRIRWAEQYLIVPQSLNRSEPPRPVDDLFGAVAQLGER